MRPLVKIFDHLFYVLIVAPMFLLFEVDALKMFDDAADDGDCIGIVLKLKLWYRSLTKPGLAPACDKTRVVSRR